MLRLLVAAGAAIAVVSPAFAAPDLAGQIAQDMPGLLAIYRDLHQHPELSFQEQRSAAILADAARRAGFEVTEKVGKTGVVAVLRNGAGPTVLVRADMDALPVTEATGLPFASTARGTPASGVESGIMHACGHDTHMTAWIEVARLMAARKAEWAGTLVMVAQPAEEITQGARAMIADPAMKRLTAPDYAIGFHDNADLPAGVVGVRPGFMLANSDSVDILVRGIGAHGAVPQNGRDPIVLASAIVMRLQTLVSRENDPFDPAVVTVGSIHGGTKHNIIPDEVRLQLTVRSYSEQTRQRLFAGIRRIAEGEAMASGLPPELMPVVRYDESGAKATYNTPALAARARTLLDARMGTARVADGAPVMAGEDFGEFARAAGEHTQSLLLWVGGRDAAELAAARREGRELPGLHSARWAPVADKVIGSGAEALTTLAMDLMKPARP